MRNLLFWINVVGFSISELAILFQVSTSYLARIIRRNNTSTSSIQSYIYNSLFERFEYEAIEQGLKKWHNLEPEKRIEKWQIKLIGLQLRLDKALKNKALQETLYRKNGLILHHFMRKEAEWAGRTDRLAKWWDFKNADAKENQKRLTLLDQEEMELEIINLQTQIEKIKEYLLEA